MDAGQFRELVFGQAASQGEWFFDPDFEFPRLSPAEYVAHARSVFEMAEDLPEEYTETQICMGLQYLVNPNCAGSAFEFVSEAVPIADRIAAVRSMQHVFTGLIAPRSRARQPAEIFHAGAYTFDSTAYMWWDNFPRHGIPYSSALAPLDDAIFEVLLELLADESLVCQVSALHGLGHWSPARAELVADAIQRRSYTLPASLREYAAAAKIGCIQ